MMQSMLYLQLKALALHHTSSLNTRVGCVTLVIASRFWILFKHEKLLYTASVNPYTKNNANASTALMVSFGGWMWLFPVQCSILGLVDKTLNKSKSH